MPELTVDEFHPAPAWLTHDYVETRLREYFQDEQLSLQKLNIKPGTAKGENYASVMTRINVKYKSVADAKKSEDRSATFLVKTTYEVKDSAAHLLIPYGIYTREMDMYEIVLPKLLAMVRQQLSDPQKLFAGTVHVDRSHSSIMFEDLSLEQYVVADRIKGLDLAHAKLTLQRLAQFHATAAALKESEPRIFAKNFDRGLFNQQTRSYAPMYQSLLRALIRSIELDEQLSRRYGAKLERVCEHFMEYNERMTAVNERDFMTLTHGDLWTTNMMFKYDDQGRPTNVILIDFQFSVWSSPAIDLHYFFNTSLQEELRLHCQTELVQFYYYKLVEALKQLKYGGHIPSLFEFQMQFEARAFYAFFSALVFQPVMIYNGNEEASLDYLLSDCESGMRLQNSVFQNKVVQQKLHKWLPIFDHKGLLDDMN